MAHIYDTLAWRLARSRALRRDGSRCSVARLIGGDCSTRPLHVHHIRPVSEGGDPYAEANLLTACASHHPTLEALRRRLLAAMAPEPVTRPVCRHRHQSIEAREQCERRMSRQQLERRTRGLTAA